MKVETIRAIGGILLVSAVVLAVASNLAITAATSSMAATPALGYIIVTAPGLPTVQPTSTPADAPQGEPTSTPADAPQVEPTSTPADAPQVGLSQSAPADLGAGELSQFAPVESPQHLQPVPAGPPVCATGVTDPYCNLPVLALSNEPAIAPAATMTAEQEAYSRRRTR